MVFSITPLFTLEQSRPVRKFLATKLFLRVKEICTEIAQEYTGKIELLYQHPILQIFFKTGDQDMKAVFLDTETLIDLDLSPIENVVTSLECYRQTSSEELRERIENAEIIILNKVRIDKKVLHAAKKLKLICLVATGKDNVDCDAAKEIGITVCNCQSYGTDSVVQHVFSCILALHTKLIEYNSAVKAGKWQSAQQFCFLDFPILELKGKTLGIIGHGTLGSGVAKVAEAFGMKVVIGAIPGREGKGKINFDEFLPMIDVLSLHCPLTKESTNLIDAKALSAMKTSAFLINAARGGIVNEEDLAQALREGTIAGAATDVLTIEPPKEGNILLDASIPNLIITPHSAWGSDAARTTIINQTAENIDSFSKGSPVRIAN